MGFNEIPFRAKYGNVPVEAIVHGERIKFRSKLEYRFAQYLDFLKSIGDIKSWHYEFHKFVFPDRDRPPYEYTPDFLVRNDDNTFAYYETKGMLAKYDMTKFKLLFDERPYVHLTLVFWTKPKLSVNKAVKLERYLQGRIIWDAKKLLRDTPIDLS